VESNPKATNLIASIGDHAEAFRVHVLLAPIAKATRVVPI
jgi:hypothetical protein